MTEQLKTLKEIFEKDDSLGNKDNFGKPLCRCNACDEGIDCDMKPIKTEAIKWYKEISSSEFSDAEGNFNQVRNWIRTFFNLSEEECQ